MRLRQAGVTLIGSAKGKRSTGAQARWSAPQSPPIAATPVDAERHGARPHSHVGSLRRCCAVAVARTAG